MEEEDAVKQIDPMDLTGILQTDTTVLRTGLLNVKSVLEPLVQFRENVGVEQLWTAVEESLEKIEAALVEEEGYLAAKSANA
jgi:hypothetical protein